MSKASADARRKIISLAVKEAAKGRKPRVSYSAEGDTQKYIERGDDYEDLQEGQTLGEYWHAQIEAASKVFEKWEGRADKIIKRYRDERDSIEGQRKRFNILWSNIEVLKPALYGRSAKPQVSRRYDDQDPVARTASEILERCLTYEVEQYSDFDASMKYVVQDKLLPGRGTVWLRYEPTIEQLEPDQVTNNAETGEEEDKTPDERITAQRTCVDYVYWKDFLHSPARTWEEVWWVARRVYMGRKEGTERFGDVFKLVPLETPRDTKDDKEGRREALKQKAVVWEIWNKNNKKVCWLAKGYQELLDERPDPLELEDYFPCPRPLYATMTTGSLVPIPDYVNYQDQADEIDSLTNRINLLLRALKAVGVYNAEYKALHRLLSEGQDNILFPVDQWAAFAEKGGIKGAVELLDVSTIAEIITKLYEAREQAKQGIYEIFGLSDIMRGATKATETLGAQQLKANFGSLRLRSSQGEVARFATDIFKYKAEIITSKYEPEIMMQMSGIQFTDDGQNNQLIQQALDLLKNEPIRNFRIEVEADILAQIDDQQEKDDRVQFTEMLGLALEKSLPVVQAAPEIAPLVLEAIAFAVRGFRVGRTMEAAIEKATAAIQQSLSQPKPPSPEQQQVELDRARLDFEKQKHMDEMQVKGAEVQIKGAVAMKPEAPQIPEQVDPNQQMADVGETLAHTRLMDAQAIEATAKAHQAMQPKPEPKVIQ